MHPTQQQLLQALLDISKAQLSYGFGGVLFLILGALCAIGGLTMLLDRGSYYNGYNKPSSLICGAYIILGSLVIHTTLCVHHVDMNAVSRQAAFLAEWQYTKSQCSLDPYCQTIEFSLDRLSGFWVGRMLPRHTPSANIHGRCSFLSPCRAAPDFRPRGSHCAGAA